MPLKLDKLGIYILTLLLSQLFLILEFLMEYFEKEIYHQIVFSSLEINNFIDYHKRIIISKIKTLRALPTILAITMVLLLAEGCISLWAFKTQFGRFQGFPFGRHLYVNSWCHFI